MCKQQNAHMIIQSLDRLDLMSRPLDLLDLVYVCVFVIRNLGALGGFQLLAITNMVWSESV
jgi:hypothetical protein